MPLNDDYSKTFTKESYFGFKNTISSCYAVKTMITIKHLRMKKNGFK